MEVPRSRAWDRHNHVGLGYGLVRRWLSSTGRKEERCAQERHPRSEINDGNAEQAGEAPTKPDGGAGHISAEIHQYE